MKEIQFFNFLLEQQLRNDRPITVGEVRAHLRIPDATMYRMLKVLMDECMIFKVKRGQYAISCYWLTSSLNDVQRSYDTAKWIKIL